MPHRKWRFEALEERRLLAALVAPSTPASSVSPSSVDPSALSAASTTPSTTSADQSGSQSDGTASDNYAEYAPSSASQSAGAATSNASSDAGAYSSNYGSSSYDNSPSNEYVSAPTNTSKAPATTSSPAQPAVTTSLQPAAGDPGNTQTKATSADLVTINPTTASPGPSAAVSPPAARTTADLVGLESESAGMPADALTGRATTDAGLVAPVALSAAGTEFNGITTAIDTEDGVRAAAERFAPAADFGAGEPIAGWTAVNFAAIDKGVDEVFDRLERLGNELNGVGATRFAEWLVIAGGACAAFEYARARYREGGPWQAAAGWPFPYEPRLRRRWFRFRSVR